MTQIVNEKLEELHHQTIVSPDGIQHPWNIVFNWTDAELAQIGIYRVIPLERKGHENQLLSATYFEKRNNRVYEMGVWYDPPPPKVEEYKEVKVPKVVPIEHTPFLPQLENKSPLEQYKTHLIEAINVHVRRVHERMFDKHDLVALLKYQEVVHFLLESNVNATPNDGFIKEASISLNRDPVELSREWEQEYLTNYKLLAKIEAARLKAILEVKKSDTMDKAKLAYERFGI